MKFIVVTERESRSRVVVNLSYLVFVEADDDTKCATLILSDGNETWEIEVSETVDRVGQNIGEAIA